MHRGYVKLWRKVFDSGIGREHTTFVVWVWLLCNVTRKPLNYIVRGQMIRLEPGEIITGRKVIAANLYTTERAVRTALDHLQTWGNVAIRATKRFSIIKVVNWELYQETGILSGQQEVQETTKKRPRNDQEATTKQECKEVKNVKNKDRATNRRRQIPTDFELTEELKAYAIDHGLAPGTIPSIFQHFKDHHQAKGSVMLDWNAAWRTWVNRDKQFRRSTPQRARSVYPAGFGESIFDENGQLKQEAPNEHREG